MTVVRARNALFAALKFVPEGTKMTIYTDRNRSAGTNVVATLRKEVGTGWDDWQIESRTPGVDPSLFRATWVEGKIEAITSKKIAETMEKDSDLWAEINF